MGTINKHEKTDSPYFSRLSFTEALIGAVYHDAQKRGCNWMMVVKEMLERLGFFEPVR